MTENKDVFSVLIMNLHLQLTTCVCTIYYLYIPYNFLFISG